MNTKNQGTDHTIQSKAVDIPDVLLQIPDPPKQLFALGFADNLTECLQTLMVAIVGSRKVTAYGRTVTERLAAALARAGVTIVSGLAIGVDAIAHRAALESGGRTLAILGGGLDNIYPAANQQLAQRILQQGGAILSEYSDDMPALPHQFVARNRLISGLCRAVIITEAAAKSGSLHTAAFALEQGKEVLAVPGSILSPSSEGTNQLIKTGATPVTNIQDILDALGIQRKIRIAKPRGANANEQLVLDLLLKGDQDGAALLAKSGLETPLFNQTLTMLEITGKIRSLGGNQWTISATG